MLRSLYIIFLFSGIISNLTAKGFNDTLSHHYSFASALKQKKDTLFIPEFFKYNGNPINLSPTPVLLSATQVISLYIKPTFSSAKWNNGPFRAFLKGRLLTGSSGAMIIAKEFELTVEYNISDANTYKAKDILIHTLTKENAYTILEIDEMNSRITDASGQVVSQEQIDEKERLFYFGNQIQYDRVFTVTENSLGIAGYIEKKTEAGTGNLLFTWPHQPYAEEYDFEWNHIDDYTGTSQRKSPADILATENSDYIRQLKKQSARVTLRDSFYSLPPAFESGYLLIRVRANGKRGQQYDQPLNGKWKDTLIAISNTNTIIPGKDKMNWQYQGFFSDDGKRKDMVVFADGTLRQRQSIVSLNTEKNILVSETMYDHQGRPALHVLPAPPHSSVSPALQYYNNFNRNLQNLPYLRTDFDTSSNQCAERIPSPININSGAGKYYGSSGASSNAYPYIASAEGFPFTQTSYTPDPSGRIRASGLAGIHHQIGNGHFKSYEYANPTQQELDTLFGNNIGNAVFYDKESLTDENGQMMITYKDSKGNIIATAFSGRTPAMLDPLDRENQSITVNFLEEGNAADSVNNTITTTKNILFPKSTDLTLRLGFAGEQFKTAVPGWADSLCMDCIYDLELTITNSCGTVFLKKELTIGNISQASIFTCQQNQFLLDTTLLLAPDKYTVFKKITINKAAQEMYEAEFLALMRTDTIRRRIFQYIPPNPPNIECTNGECIPCKYNEKEIETPDGDMIVVREKITSDNEVIPCSDYCSKEPVSPCQGALQAMMQDVSPGGQYGEYLYTYDDDDEASVRPDLYPLSVYNTCNQLGKDHPNMNGSFVLCNSTISNTQDIRRTYKFPISPYRDANGNESRVPVYDENGNFVSSKLPQSLSVKDFVRYWQPSWAASLVGYHPEYCYYMWCLSNESSVSYNDKLLMQSPSPMSLMELKSNDPLYQSGSLPDRMKTNIEKFYEIEPDKFLTIEEMAAAVVHCNGIEETEDFIQCAREHPLYQTAETEEILEKEWFYLKTFYIMVRNKYLDAERKKYVESKKGCMTNDCIGQNTFAGETIEVDPVLGTYNDNPTTFDGTNLPSFGSQNDACCVYIRNIPDPTNPTSLIIHQVSTSPEVCSIYHNKRKIFYDAEDIFDYVDTARLKENNNETIYNNCGKCIEAFQLELILNALASSERLTTESLLPEAPPLVLYPELESHFTNSENGNYRVHPNINTVTNTLSLSFKNGNNQQEVFNVSLAAAKEIEWTKIKAISCFETISKHEFTVVATLHNETRVTLKGSTEYIDFIACRPPPTCKITAAGTRIKKLLSFMLKRPDQYLAAPGLQRLPNIFINSFERSEPKSSKVIFWNLRSKTISGNSEIINGEVITLILHRDLLAHLWSNSHILGMPSTFFSTFPENRRTDTDILFNSRLSQREQTEIYKRIIRYLDQGNSPSRLKAYLKKCKVRITNPERQNGIASFKDFNSYEFIPPAGKQSDTCQHKRLVLTGKNKDNIKTASLYINVDCITLADCCTPVSKHPLCCLPAGSIQTFPIDNACEEDAMEDAGIVRLRMEEDYFRLKLDSIRKAYYRKCFNALESFSGSYVDETYHYTLYYYDRAGNLVQTVPPAGVVPLTSSQMASTRNHRRNNNTAPVVNAHRLSSYYRYNSFNQPISSATPDGGVTQYSYDEAGRTILTQDALHRQKNRARYLLYDTLGRTIESGECNASLFIISHQGENKIQPRIAYTTFANIVQSDNTRKEVTRTIFDRPANINSENWFSNSNRNLRNRIGSILYFSSINSPHEHATHYAYDIHGNIREMVQEYSGLARQYPYLLNGNAHIKKMEYEYDLTSQKLHTLIYQRGKRDEFIQRYAFDADNRLTSVKTPIHIREDAATVDTDAKYKYYPHGQVSRIEIGEDKIQGLDFAYTVNGWLKAVNGDLNDPSSDMGKDGINELFARDVAGFTLGYHSNDYTPVSGNNAATGIRFISPNELINKSLYNGNISYQLLSNTAFASQPMQATLYRYDQLNRLRDMKVVEGIENSSSPLQQTEKFRNIFTYDANGNILTQIRKDGNGRMSDALTYHYNINQNNQLLHVSDTVNSLVKSNDVDNQTAGNYRYDAIGRLISDRAEGIEQIQWGNHHKPIQIIKSNRDSIEFSYDAFNNRISKRFRDTTTWYVKDFSGNTIASYKINKQAASPDEFYIYGKDRIGTYRKNNSTETGIAAQWRGEKNYEFSNHLGNVMAVFSDRKILVADTAFRAYIVLARDYYPFGMEMEERTSTISSYKYGFNGFEKDDEVKGNGNQISFNDYSYDTRLGRRWQTDPVYQYDLSGYVSFNNNPLFYLDPSGESAISIFVKQVAKSGLKKAAKESVEAALKAKLKAYTQKGWAKQIAGDALDAIDVASSQTWWEYAIELVPVAGDAYGASKLGEKGYRIYKITQKFESIAEWAGKAAGKAFKTLGPNILKGKGAERIEFITKKFNNQGTHLTESDLAGAVKEIYGLKSGFKKDGVTPFQHLKEVQESLNGMKNHIEILKKEIKDGAFEGDSLKAAEGILHDVTKQYNEISNTLDSARKASKNF